MLPPLLRLLSTVLCLLCLATFSAGATPLKITIAVNHSPPYRIVEKLGSETNYSGYYVDIIREACKRSSIETNFINVPFRRALFLLERGDVDLMLGPNKTEKRKQYMYFLETALPREDKSFYVQKDATDIQSLEGLTGKTVGVLRGSTYTQQFDTARHFTKLKATNYSGLFRMLGKGRIDAVIVPSLLGKYLEKKYSQSIKKSSLILEGRPSFIALSKFSNFYKTQGYLPLEKALKDMERDGTLYRIRNKYTE
ncbi:substrate-binding periplasmic protein [Sneathiella limimaris]|uniref:substrate-binding periplasmic protein n=1 Tax=Sneathiella limimaris TaxID=1964213 RepID=UPI00146A0D8A|nr:transporter substrate-binding domain-containing protein [Sneathiella limimaris]